jgi:choline dehydrogenase
LALPDRRDPARVRSADPGEAPRIQPNYLAAETDRRAMIDGLKWCRRFLATDALRPYFDVETMPGERFSSDDEILGYARSRGATVYHAVSSCRMGQTGWPSSTTGCA